MADYTTVKNAGANFNVVKYTGNGSAGHGITGVGFQPDWVWIKNRSGSSNHTNFDSVRGQGKALYQNNTTAETTVTGHLTSLDSDGFTLGDNSGTGSTNGNGDSYVSWNWKAGGAASSNGDGTITSQVSVNTTAGISVITYSGNGTGNSTIGHGLGATPDFIIIKRRDSTGNWATKNPAYNSAADPKIGYMDVTQAFATDTNVFGTSAAFNNQTFTVGDWNGSNNSSGTYVAYAFAAKRGFSKFGSYTGNNNSDGPFVHLGFKPAFVFVKNSQRTQNWCVYDNQRPGYNPIQVNLQINDSAAERVNNAVDFTSTGFKLRSNDGDSNGYAEEYIYFAFAEEPLVGDNPATGAIF